MPSLKTLLALAAALGLTPSTFALALPALSPDTPLLSAIPISPAGLHKPSAPFEGKGQVRTRWLRGDDYPDLGCLTNEGRWTVDEALCGVFEADRARPPGYGVDVFRLRSQEGACRIFGAKFVCERGVEGGEFGAWTLTNAIPGVECLRWGQYGPMASFFNNPPEKDDKPEEIHLVTYRETGKYVWLTWSPLE